VCETVSSGKGTGQKEAGPTAARARGPRGRNRLAALSVVVVVAAGAVSGWRATAFAPPANPGSGPGSGGPAAPATAAVTRQDLSAVTPVTATLGYAGSYPVTGQGGGTLTWLPSPGQVIKQGQALYRVDNGSPVVLLFGSVPDWRSLDEGATGQDVSQLNHDLVHLGYADRTDITALGWDYYSWETASAVQRLEAHLGVSVPPGSLTLGQLVFEPQTLRVAQVTGSLGGPASGTVLTATSDRHVVTISLSTSQESEVAPGDAVTVTLPDGATTSGRIFSVGTVASGTAAAATVPVMVTLTHPSAAGTLDQAPVTVNVTTASSQGPVLAVPVGALLAQAPGGYVVEVVGPDGTRRYVPVQPGIFDDADGLVQVTGALTPGQSVVVPAT
jgi:hypothetical protein